VQGLGWVACGTVFSRATYAGPLRIKLADSRVVATLASLAGFIALGYSIPKYYRRRFGWVEPRGPSNQQVVIVLLVFGMLLLWGRRLEMFAKDLTQVIDSMVPHLAIGA
jgi:hypothetical protein